MGILKELYKYKKCNGNKDIVEIYSLLLEMMGDLEVFLKDNYHDRAWHGIQYEYTIQESSCNVTFYAKNPFAHLVANSAPVIILFKLTIYVATNKDGSKEYRSVYELSSFLNAVNGSKPLQIINTPSNQIKNIIESSSLKLDESNISLLIDELDKSWKLVSANIYS